MSIKVLYLGDTSLTSAASYLAGVLAHHGIAYEYVASDVKFRAEQLTEDCRAMIISDYMASQFRASDFELIIARVKAGMGLLMIGGWESFTGLGGNYHTTPLANVLPVSMRGSDDRMNSYAPCMIQPGTEHAITSNLPFAQQAVAINGYNQWHAKASGITLLSLQRYSAMFHAGAFQFAAESHHPLLVVDTVEQGRVACYAGDVAPHWAGGFVDWGNQRQVLRGPGAEEVELGNWYVEFFGNLVKWVAQELHA